MTVWIMGNATKEAANYFAPKCPLWVGPKRKSRPCGPVSGHRRAVSVCPKSATSGHEPLPRGELQRSASRCRRILQAACRSFAAIGSTTASDPELDHQLHNPRCLSVVFSFACGFTFLDTALTIMIAQTILQGSYFLGLVIRAIFTATHCMRPAL
jgi:hypothetical protein